MSREPREDSVSEDEALVAAVSSAARDLADDGGQGPSPSAWHRLARSRGGRVRMGWWSRPSLLVAAGAAGLALLLGVANLARRGSSPPLTFTVDGDVRGAAGEIDAAGAAGREVRFSDGTEIQLGSNARLRVTAQGAHGARLRLQAGEAHFQVVHRPRAAWFVDAGPYLIEVTGTAFDVRWSETEQVAEVRMRSGSVRVTGPLLSERVMLGRGQHLVARVRAGDVRIDDTTSAAARSTSAASPEPVASAGGAESVEAAPASPVAVAPVAATQLAGDIPRRLMAGDVPSRPSDGKVEPRPIDQGPRVAAKPRRMLALSSPVATAVRGPEASTPTPGRPTFEPPAPEVTATAPPAPAPVRRWVQHRWADEVAAGDGRAVLAEAQTLGVEATLKEADGEDLAAFADAARYGGRADLAVQALLESRRRFPGTAQAHAAAFLLGRAADDGGDTRVGLAWYRRYLSEVPTGSYAAEALGREMLAIERLLGPAQARSIAGEYLQRFPNGTYLLQARAILDNR